MGNRISNFKFQISNSKPRSRQKKKTAKKNHNLEPGAWNLPGKVMAFGTFDIFHKGHENFLKQARRFGDYLLVSIARDRVVRQVKGKLPRNKENVRLKNVESSGLADKVILGNLRDKYAAIRRVRPDTIALGYDQTAFTEGLAEAFPDVKIVRLKPYHPEIYKSSKIIQKSKIKKTRLKSKLAAAD